jgi:hypothetical protein
MVPSPHIDLDSRAICAAERPLAGEKLGGWP